LAISVGLKPALDAAPHSPHPQTWQTCGRLLQGTVAILLHCGTSNSRSSACKAMLQVATYHQACCACSYSHHRCSCCTTLLHWSVLGLQRDMKCMRNILYCLSRTVIDMLAHCRSIRPCVRRCIRQSTIHPSYGRCHYHCSKQLHFCCAQL
jgi:hypothetical protein